MCVCMYVCVCVCVCVCVYAYVFLFLFCCSFVRSSDSSFLEFTCLPVGGFVPCFLLNSTLPIHFVEIYFLNAKYAYTL